jgi:predicted site-specific integrase-resolvase
MRTYSTAQVAKGIGVHKITLIRWLLDGKVPEPRRINQAGQEIRVWADRDVERVKKFKQNNCKGRGRKAKPKR